MNARRARVLDPLHAQLSTRIDAPARPAASLHHHIATCHDVLVVEWAELTRVRASQRHLPALVLLVPVATLLDEIVRGLGQGSACGRLEVLAAHHARERFHWMVPLHDVLDEYETLRAVVAWTYGQLPGHDLEEMTPFHEGLERARAAAVRAYAREELLAEGAAA